MVVLASLSLFALPLYSLYLRYLWSCSVINKVGLGIDYQEVLSIYVVSSIMHVILEGGCGVGSGLFKLN